MKIFIVGFPKAGTSSIQYALQKAKIPSIHWARYNLPNGLRHLGHLYRKGQPAASVGALIDWAKKDGIPLLSYLNDYDAFTQMDISLNKTLNFWPQLTDVPTLNEQYPNSKFIFNTRPIHKWINSVNNWGNLRKRLTRLDIPGLPSGKGDKDTHLEDWHNWHLENIKQFFTDKPDQLIVFDIENDNPKKLAKFLGIKNMVWEHKNKNTKKLKKQNDS